MTKTSILLALATFLMVDVQAASTAAPPQNLVVCSRMADSGERLRCYDTQMAAMLAGVAGAEPATGAPAPKSELAAAPLPNVPSGSAAVPPPAPERQPSTAPLTAEQKFGAIGLPREAREKAADPNKLLLSTIASIRQLRPKLWLIVLANGQIWLQDGTQITMFFRAGYDVHIEKGIMEGEFRMWTTQTGDKNWVKVTRIQ